MGCWVWKTGLSRRVHSDNTLLALVESELERYLSLWKLTYFSLLTNNYLFTNLLKILIFYY